MKFGGPLGAMRDPVSGMILNPRAFGDATLADPSLEPMAKRAITQALEEHFVQAMANGASPAAIAAAPDFAATIASAASATLGSQITISILNVMFPE